MTDPAPVSARGIDGPPGLVVEVLSPGTATYDRTIKARRYAALGVPHLWPVDPEGQRIACHRREGDEHRLVIVAAPGDTLTHPDVPTVAIPVAPLWQEAPRSLRPPGPARRGPTTSGRRVPRASAR